MVFLHCFTYYILYEKLRNFFKEISLHEYSSSHILCFELIHQFLENFKFYFWVHITLRLLNTREGVFFGGRGRRFHRKQINEDSNWKEKSMQFVWGVTCPTIHRIKHFHLSDLTKNTTSIFPHNPLIESFGFICPTFLVSFPTFLVSLWSFKQGFVLCLS